MAQRKRDSHLRRFGRAHNAFAAAFFDFGVAEHSGGYGGETNVQNRAAPAELIPLWTGSRTSTIASPVCFRNSSNRSPTKEDEKRPPIRNADIDTTAAASIALLPASVWPLFCY
jgi:hypothetical protein